MKVQEMERHTLPGNFVCSLPLDLACDTEQAEQCFWSFVPMSLKGKRVPNS